MPDASVVSFCCYRALFIRELGVREDKTARAPLELLPAHVAGKILRFLVDAVALLRYRATSRALRGMFDDDEAEPLWKACCCLLYTSPSPRDS